MDEALGVSRAHLAAVAGIRAHTNAPSGADDGGSTDVAAQALSRVSQARRKSTPAFPFSLGLRACIKTPIITCLFRVLWTPPLPVTADLSSYLLAHSSATQAEALTVAPKRPPDHMKLVTLWGAYQKTLVRLFSQRSRYFRHWSWGWEQVGSIEGSASSELSSTDAS
jgi:hypothetical protein